MNLLKIRLLGVPEISCGNQPLSFRTRKVLALLIYLSVEGGMHSRESLMALLWPDSESTRAAATFRGTLSRLRRSLQPAGDVIMTQEGKVGFDFACAVDLDLNWLAAASATGSGQALTATDSGGVTHEGLTRILEIDRGEFLAGFSLADAPEFDTWAATERQMCQRRVEAVYDRLTRKQLEMGDGAAAIETAARWLRRAPLNESAYRRLMTAHALTGERAAALATYARCQQTLKAELKIEAAQETARLAERIRKEHVSSPRKRTSAPQSKRRLPMPFVGRAEERSKLAEAFRLSSVEGTRAAVVIGASGVGKTRLVRTFLEWAALDTLEVELWQGRAFEMGGRLPYEPVIEALRARLEEENAPEDLLDDVWLAELSQLIPELRGRYPDLPPPMKGDAMFVRSRLFAAVTTLGDALAARRPVVFVLDDFQWADADTRDMIHYAARRWAESGARILLLLTVGQETYAANAGLREWLMRLERDVPMLRLLLDSLNGPAVQQLIATLAAGTADEAKARAFADWLWVETNGSPFFIEELLQMLIEQGILTTSAANEGYDFAAALQHIRSVGRVPVPPGMRDVILARLAGLTEIEVGLLLAAAVLGRECSFIRLCQVAGLDESTALPALEALLNARLLGEKENARRPYALAHDHVREVVYSVHGEARRRVMHRRALIALEADGAPAAECAFHAVASLLDEPAFRYSLAAGNEALGKHALQESLTHYERARAAARVMGERSTRTAPELILDLYRNRGRVLELTYQYPSADDNYREMFELAEIRGDQALKQAALSARCIIHATHTPLFNPPMARELGEASLELACALPDRTSEARALWCMMLVEFHAGGDGRKVLTYGEEALAIARALGLRELIGYIMSNLTWAYLTQDRLEAAREANGEAEAVWRELGNLPMMADTYTMKLAIQRLAGEYEAVLATGREALRLSQSIDNVMHQSMALLVMGDIHSFQGRLGKAFAEYETARIVIEENGDELSLQGYYASMVSVYLAAGSPERAEQWADRLYALREELLPVFRTGFLVNAAQAKIARGKVKEGEAILKEAFASFDSDGLSAFAVAPLFVTDGQLQLVLNRPQRTLNRVEELIEHLIRIGSRYHLAEALWLKGKAWRALARTNQAEEALVEAKAVAEAQGEYTILWQIEVELAQLLTEAGDGERAALLHRQALAIVREIAEQIEDPALQEHFLAKTGLSSQATLVNRAKVTGARL